MERASVGIIGAGPAGLAAAIQLRLLGVSKVVLVDRQDFPRDKTCGSAISPKGIKVLQALDVLDEVSARAQWINGMRLVTPSGHDLRMVGQSDAALILKRRSFDEILLRRAQALGVDFRPDFQVTNLLMRDDRVVGFCSSNGSSFGTAYTFVADGAKSRFAVERGERRMLQTIMGWWDNFEHRPNEIEMMFDSLVAPLYGWLFPEGGSSVNIGICYEDVRLERNSRTLFEAFIDKHFRDRILGATLIGQFKGHPISYSTNIERLTSPGRFVLGEAGRMTHPATGEGIYQAMMSGVEAAKSAARALNGAEKESEAAAAYERACRSAFRLSFRVGMIWRTLVKRGVLDGAARLATFRLVQRHLAHTMAHM